MKSPRYEPAAAQFWGPGNVTTARPRLLLISYHFPPGQSVGSLRWQRLSLHAAERGLELDVITLHPSSMHAPDMSRLAELPVGTRVYGIPTRLLRVEHVERGVWRMYRSRCPNAAAGRLGSLGRHETRWSRRDLAGGLRRAYYAWLEYARYGRWAEMATILGLRLTDLGVHRAVVSCGPPHMVHEAARRVGREKGLPLVIDFRDPWSLVQRLPETIASPVWFALAARYERRVMAAAALVVMNTDPARLAMQVAYPGAAQRIITVMNGYDEEAVPRSRHGGRFTIAYAGTIYLDRDPRPLFRAAAEVVRRLGLGPDEFGIELLGKVATYAGMPIDAIAREEGLEGFVRASAPRPRREVLEFLADATVLLSLPQDSDMAIPSKVFEYMQFDAWILALALPGSAVELLLRYSGADVVSPDDVSGIANVLQGRYQQYREGERPSKLAHEKRYSRQAQAMLLFDAVEGCLDAGALDSPVTRSRVVARVRQVARRIERVRVLRRMQRIARSSAALAAQVARARTICFVCQGNIIRSPFAAALLRDRIRPLADIEVYSVGLRAGEGKAAHPLACQGARPFGIDLTTHCSRRVGLTELLRTDIVLVMEAEHLIEIERRFPACDGKAYLLGCLNPDGPLEIDDPVYAPLETFEARFQQIDAAVSRLATLLVQAGRASTDGWTHADHVIDAGGQRSGGPRR